MREIYNEGRVVGLSAYELYVRQLLSIDPEATPMTEREWLAATLSETSSMILRVPNGTTRGYHDFELPKGSALCGCTLIYGSLFEGKAIIGEDGYWATSVSDYGRLISNVYTRHPVTPGKSEDVPAKEEPVEPSTEFLEQSLNFVKIVGALMLQPGRWDENTQYIPVQTESSEDLVINNDQQLLGPVRGEDVPDQMLTPDLSERGFIRLSITEDLTSDIYIFLHGFVYKPMLTGVLNQFIDGQSNRPQDGDFLGPSLYPWGCPVILIYTPELARAYNKVLENKINVLASLQTTLYYINWLDESGQSIQTEDGEDVLIPKSGTVAEMWQDGGSAIVTYYVSLTDQSDENLLTEQGDELLVSKEGTLDEMTAEGGVF